jgi:hypothetical protein
MSYDLDCLHEKYGIQIASVQFATVSDASGLVLIATTAGQAIVIHQVTLVASVWVKLSLSTSASSATPFWEGAAAQTRLYEPTRIMVDAGAGLVADLASVAVKPGNGVFHVYFTTQRGQTGAGLGVL